MNILAARFNNIDSKIQNIKELLVVNSVNLENKIQTVFEHDYQASKINLKRNELLDHVSKQETSKKHQKIKNRIYLKVCCKEDQLEYYLKQIHLNCMFNYKNEFKLAQKFYYLNLYTNFIDHVSLLNHMDDLTEKYKLSRADRFCFYQINLDKYLIRDNANKQILITDKKLNLIKMIRFNENCFCWQLNIINQCIVFTLFNLVMKKYFIYVFDLNLKLLSSKNLKCDTSSVFVDFCASNIYYKCPLKQTYIILDLRLNEIGRLNLGNDSGLFLHSLLDQRIIIQNNFTREIQILSRSLIPNEEDKENNNDSNLDRVHLIKSIKIEKTICLKVLVDLELNVYIVERSMQDNLIYLVCYNKLGRFIFKKTIDLFNRYKNFEIQNERIYFGNDDFVKMIV
jgi:hypothetical protein